MELDLERKGRFRAWHPAAERSARPGRCCCICVCVIRTQVEAEAETSAKLRNEVMCPLGQVLQTKFNLLVVVTLRRFLCAIIVSIKIELPFSFKTVSDSAGLGQGLIRRDS